MARIEECYRLAEERFERSFDRPRVELDREGEVVTARVIYRDHNADFLLQTVPHEAAHLIAHELFGSRIRPHGPQWQAIMTDLYLLPATRCHDYPVQRRRGMRYLYRCGCQAHIPFTPQRHALVKRGRRYLCRLCGDMLHFTGKQAAQ